MEPLAFLGISAAAVVVFVGLDLRAPAFRQSLSSNRHLLKRMKCRWVVVGVGMPLCFINKIRSPAALLVPRLFDFRQKRFCPAPQMPQTHVWLVA